MSTLKDLRMRYWLYVLGFVSLIYSTLYIVRPICTFLKESTPFSLLINVLCVVILITIVLWIFSRIRVSKFSSYFILAIIVIGYLYGIMTLHFPEEKIHLIEYGFLAYLVYKAVQLDVQGPIAYVYSFILVTAFGWIDEGIQYLLPNRYYQIEDVILNSMSGILGLLLVFVFIREKKESV